MPNTSTGRYTIKANGIRLRGKGASDYQMGYDKREGIVGSDAIHGPKEMPQVPYIELAITNGDDIDLKTLLNQRNVTITLEQNNGKTVVGKDMWFAGDGTVNTEEGEIACRWECELPLDEV